MLKVFSPSERHIIRSTCEMQVYIATGMWACHLAALVQSRLFISRPAEVAHNALLLAIFASSGFKEEHTGLLAMTLPALLCCVPSSVCITYYTVCMNCA